MTRSKAQDVMMRSLLFLDIVILCFVINMIKYKQILCRGCVISPGMFRLEILYKSLFLNFKLINKGNNCLVNLAKLFRAYVAYKAVDIG